MRSLAPAHRGYEYQDILVACRLVDLLLGSVLSVRVDEKLFLGDVFDDLTTIGADGTRERSQIKHVESGGQLSLATFTGDSRGLRLDGVIESILTDRDGPGSDAPQCRYRVILRDTPPTDPQLTHVLSAATSDPGAFVSGVETERLVFDADTIWAQRGAAGDAAFGFLAESASSLSKADLDWVCDRLIVEVGAPVASMDLTAPGEAEAILLHRVRADVGAESFPNLDRRAVDVAAAFIGTARAARQDRLVADADQLLRQAGLRSDFGAVARVNPIDARIEVKRQIAVRELTRAASETASTGGVLLVVGPPGQGKSWACQQLLGALSGNGWLVAEHYCYLGDADADRQERVLADTVFGSLMSRMVEGDDRVATDQRPRLAADEAALLQCVSQATRLEPDRRVALVVDGLDHITRVRSGSRGFDPSLSLGEALAELELPAGCVLIVLSQPGSHLRPLEEVAARRYAVPGLVNAELRQLAERMSVVAPTDPGGEAVGAVLPDDQVDGFLATLGERSAGNALYATYLCREAARNAGSTLDAGVALRSFPAFDGTLENYYEHLLSSLKGGGEWVADVIALIDFPVTRAELREIRPDVAHRVGPALEVLAPVLVEFATQGGVRIYHESFSRFLRRQFQDDQEALTGLLDRIADWLKGKGLFADPRAHRSLLSTLADAGRDQEVIELVSRDFVVNAVAAGFPSSAIIRNLAVAIGCAARNDNWPAVVRSVELSRAASTFQYERFDSTLLGFADVPMALLGPSALAEYLLENDRTVMSGRDGLQMCAAVDRFGGVPPWSHYLDAFLQEAESENTSYGNESDRRVALDYLRGRLRLLRAAGPPDGTGDANDREGGDESVHDSVRPSWLRIAEWIDERALPATEVIDIVLDTLGLIGAHSLVRQSARPGDLCLALAEEVAKGRVTRPTASARSWATAAMAHGTAAGKVHRIMALGVEAEDVLTSRSALRERLLTLTRRVQEGRIQFEPADVAVWLDLCGLAAHLDRIGLDAAEALLEGEGWYTCWLRFVVALSRAAAAEAQDQPRLAAEALRILTEDLRPFAGDPRSCDLHALQGLVETSLRRAVALLDDGHWREAIDTLLDVSDAITTTLSGEQGGPVPPDLVLRILVDSTNPARHDAATAVLEEMLASQSGRRYYSDLAEYQLLGARLALAADNRTDAEARWRRACILLTAYGWRKDITIFELLDPLPVLVAADMARSRECVARVQGLCERVPLHTDGRETRHAWRRWWELLAKADPLALSEIVARRVLSECNDPNPTLYAALTDLWRAWWSTADPVVAATLRVTLETTLEADDPAALQALVQSVGTPPDDDSAVLMRSVLSRIDERPIQYRYSNSDEVVAKNDALVSSLNEVAAAAGLPLVAPVRELRAEGRPPAAPMDREPRSAGRALSSMPGTGPGSFSAGNAGISQLARAWRRRPYGAEGSEWSEDRFANALGYRLLELAAAGRDEDAEYALRTFASTSRFGESARVLSLIGNGLERNGQHRLAVIALTLSWTRTRGQLGWLTFGGETELESLQRAAAIDPDLARAVIGEEVQDVVGSGRYGTYGISQALIVGFALGRLAAPPKTAVGIAFDLWGEALGVIESRAPRVHPSDDPEDPYAPGDSGDGTVSTDNVDRALATATVASVSHPARERKRRSLSAARLLLALRPAEAGPAFDLALATAPDPTTLSWLLRLLEEAPASVIGECQGSLGMLASGPYLTVRALARRILGRAAPPCRRRPLPTLN